MVKAESKRKRQVLGRRIDGNACYVETGSILVTLGLYNYQDLSWPPTDHPAVKFLEDKVVMDCLTGNELKLPPFESKGGKKVGPLTLHETYEHTRKPGDNGCTPCGYQEMKVNKKGERLNGCTCVGGIPTYLVAYIEAVM